MVLKYVINCAALISLLCETINLVLTNRKYKQMSYLTLDAGSNFQHINAKVIICSQSVTK